jgi:hypothetical protein
MHMLGTRFSFGAALAALGLYACNQPDKSPVQVDPAGKGSARIALPALPAGFLVDSSQKALFSLEIIGPDSDTLRRSSYLLPGEPSHYLSVEGIPAGFNTFIGRLFRLDSASGKAEQTHVGRDSALIDAGRTAQIRLVLRPFTGSADVCIEVEGWASDSSCVPPPPPPIDTSIVGCHVLNVLKTGTTPGHDTLTSAFVNISRYDSSLKAIVIWNSGQMDSTFGYLVGMDSIYFGYGLPSDFQFRGKVGPTNDTIIGWFNDSLRRISGAARINTVSCTAESLVFEPPKPTKACFNFTQSKANGKTDTARIAMEGYENWVNVYTYWKGYATTYSLFSQYSGSLDSSAQVNWNIHPPAGMFPENLHVDSAYYSLNIQGTNGDGTVVRRLPQPTKALGSLLANRVACRESDFRF